MCVTATLANPDHPTPLLSPCCPRNLLPSQIGTWTPKHLGHTPSGSGGDRHALYRRSWGITVNKRDPAFLWAQWLAPVYSVALANIEGAFKQEVGRGGVGICVGVCGGCRGVTWGLELLALRCAALCCAGALWLVCCRGWPHGGPTLTPLLPPQANGAMSAGAMVDGIIVRDLQLPEQARHAYVLRPLPARARRLNTWLNLVRRRLLGIVPVSRPRLLWVALACTWPGGPTTRMQPAAGAASCTAHGCP